MYTHTETHILHTPKHISARTHSYAQVHPPPPILVHTHHRHHYPVTNNSICQSPLHLSVLLANSAFTQSGQGLLYDGVGLANRAPRPALCTLHISILTWLALFPPTCGRARTQAVPWCCIYMPLICPCVPGISWVLMYFARCVRRSLPHSYIATIVHLIISFYI